MRRLPMAAMIVSIGPSAGKYIVVFRHRGRALDGLAGFGRRMPTWLSEIQERIPYGLASPDVEDATIAVRKLLCGEGTVPLRG